MIPGACRIAGAACYEAIMSITRIRTKQEEQGWRKVVSFIIQKQ